MAEQRARNKLPEGIFDTLPDIVKQTMIKDEEYKIRLEQEAIEHERREIEREKELEKYREEERKRQEAETERKRIAREVELAVEFIRSRNVPNRIGMRQERPRTFNKHREPFEISSEFPDNEPHPELYLDGRILGFRKESIYNVIPRIKDMTQRAYDLQQDETRVQRGYFSYMMFYIWSHGQQRASTPIVTIARNDVDHIRERIDELFEKLNVFIDDIKRESAGYEYLYEGEIAHLSFYYCMVTFPEPKNHKHWGDVMELEKRQFFDIFTANNDHTDCVQQCVNRINKNYNMSLKCNTLDEIMKALNHRLCILNFHSSVKNLNDVIDYTDFVLSKNSPHKNFSVIDTEKIYLIESNGHLGMLENFKEQKRKRYYTTFRPLMKFPKCERITVCFDIECYFDPHNDQNHIPYLACACLCYDDEPGNVVEFEGKDCVAQMIDYISDICRDMGKEHVELIAHNGGGYDFHYIISSMSDPSIVNGIMIRNNNFISFQFKHREINFIVKDSLHFLTCSLSRAAKSFLNEKDRKTSFPHHEMLTENDLQKEMKEWLDVETIISVNVEKERMLITSNNIINYKENGSSKKLVDWARQYCRNDVIVLAKVWIAFKRTVYDIFQCHIVDQTYTLAGMSFRLLEAFMDRYKLMHPSVDEFVNMRKALVGGRCISLNGIYENIVALDVKSLYPAAMSLYPQPYGPYRKVKRRVDNELGVYYVKVTPCKINQHGFFPLKNNGDVTYNNVDKSYNDWYTSVDIDIGIAEGHDIEYIAFDEFEHVGYSWKNSDTIFKDYIMDVLYKLKLMYEQEQDPEKRHVLKIIMNALWGKFAQKWMDTQYKVVNEEDAGDEDEAYKIWDTNHVLKKSKKNKIIADKPIQNGIFVLSWARHHMKKLWEQCAKKDAVCLYSDTDSIFVKKEDLHLNSPCIGSEMGQLDVECTFDTFICVGKKQYMGCYKDEKGITHYKKRFKGIPQQYIRPELFSHLLESPDNKAQVDFLKFKREWGVVRGYMESKIVKQT